MTFELLILLFFLVVVVGVDQIKLWQLDGLFVQILRPPITELLLVYLLSFLLETSGLRLTHMHDLPDLVLLHLLLAQFIFELARHSVVVLVHLLAAHGLQSGFLLLFFKLIVLLCQPGRILSHLCELIFFAL